MVVDTGGADKTRRILQDFACEHRIPYTLHCLSPEETPECFITDSLDVFPQSWFPSNQPLLLDWAAARNLALDDTSADYILKLDADDELADNVLDDYICWLDRDPGKYFVSSFYDIMDGNHISERQLYTRLWRNSPDIRWTQPMHEYLTPKTFLTTLTCTSGALRTVDWRDSQGSGVRIPYRNLKVLEWHRLTHPGAMDDDSAAGVMFRYTWACEMAGMRPGDARSELVRLERLVAETDSAFLADVHYQMGRTYEAEGSAEMAVACYLRASELIFLVGHFPSLIRIVTILDTPEQNGHNRDALKHSKDRLMRVPVGQVPIGCDLQGFARATGL